MIIVVDFTDRPASFNPFELSQEEFNKVLVDARHAQPYPQIPGRRGITVAELIKDAVIEFAARRKGIIIDFPSSLSQ